MGDFEVHTNGHCFLCMDKIVSQFASVKLEPHLGLPGTYSVHSLQYLSHYLKMDMRKVFDEATVVPPELLAQVRSARLKVELCEECASLNKSFSKMYRQLEKIEMRTAAYVTLIRSKLLKAREMKVNNPGEVVDGKLKIAKVLREEAKQKCLYKLKTVPGPRIKIENRSMKQLHAQMREIKANSRNSYETMSINYKDPPGTVEYEGVKDEHPNPSPCSDIDNQDFDDSDYSMQLDGSEQPYANVLDSATCELSTSSTLTVEPKIKKCSTASDPPQYEMVGGKVKCTLCSKTFTAKGTWQHHYNNIHLKVKYKCNLCEKEFVKRSTYKRHHQNIHVGVKFKCLVCSKVFSQKDSLVQHQKQSSCKNGQLPKSDSDK